MMTARFKFFSFAFICLFFWSLAEAAYAGNLTVTPSVIDEKSSARDILKKSLTLKNESNNKITAYVFVNNILAEGGKQEFLDPSKADQSSSLANWIEISRGVMELSPGAEKNVDFNIAVNLRARPGRYHAIIYFAEGSTRAEAENRLSSAASVLINLEVADNAREKLQLKKFIPDKRFFSGDQASFSYILENIGNKAVVYAGDIRIYNNRGEEVSTVPIDSEQDKVLPGNGERLAASNSVANNFGMGRYKALLTLEYGSSGQGTVQDTVFFWVIPWARIAMIFIGLAAAVICLTSLWHRRYLNKIKNKN